MNIKNTNKLLKRYPKLYRQHKLPATETCMCWGFECGDGWFDLIDKLSKDIVKVSKKTQAVQVKQKLGGLRFYVDFANDKVYKLIRDAERKSYTICEECGTTEGATINKDGYMRTLCDSCRIKLK